MRNKLIKFILAPGVTLAAFTFTASAQPPVVPAPAGLATSGPGAPQYPTPSGFYGVPVAVGEQLFAAGGPVYVTDLGPTGAGYSEDLFVASPANSFGLFMNNHATPNGTTYYLGNYAAGTEIEFGLYVFNTGNTWYDGPGSRNVDGDVHAYMVNDYEGFANTTYVGFEDLYGPVADFNYTDEVYAFTGVAASVNPPAVPDSASTVGLLGLGCAGLTAFQRRFKK